jgi:DNA/RNA-binding domain of Phe-tRNA-synthetase-like protein
LNGTEQSSVELAVAPELREAAPHLALGLVRAAVQVAEHDERLQALIQECISGILQTLDLPKLPDLPEIHGLRKAFRAAGKEPSRYRGSQESLLRRILQGKGLFAVNTVVDINNLVSLESRHSVGTYDVAHISNPVIFRVGRPGESYQGIGKDPIDVAGLPVLADRDGPFGSPHRDSARARITLSTREIMMVIISFSGLHRLPESMQRAVDLLRTYSGADTNTIKTAVVD